MARLDRCDMCGNEATIVAKLFISPPRRSHSNYTATCEIGTCCLPKIQQSIKWTKRRTVPRKTQTAKKRHAKAEKAVA